MVNCTDLAVESYESRVKTKLDGVIVRDEGHITIVDVVNEAGASALKKPIGRYVTLKVEPFMNDMDIFDGRLDDFISVLKSILPDNLTSVLVASLGNKDITADSLGPKVNNYIFSTRHIIKELQKSLGLDNIVPVSAIATGVLGETGIETAEIIKGVVSQINPSVVIVVDALAASSTDRLGTTVQLSNAGISPGSGVGNHRFEISKKTLGIPVVSIGIPTVVCTSVISGNDADTSFVTPREIDIITEQGAKLIGMGINSCLQRDISLRDLYALVG